MLSRRWASRGAGRTTERAKAVSARNRPPTTIPLPGAPQAAPPPKAPLWDNKLRPRCPAAGPIEKRPPRRTAATVKPCKLKLVEAGNEALHRRAGLVGMGNGADVRRTLDERPFAAGNQVDALFDDPRVPSSSVPERAMQGTLMSFTPSRISQSRILPVTTNSEAPCMIM